MDKTPLQLAQEAFAEWLATIDALLHDAELSFEEFTGHGLRRELKEAGESLARAEGSVRKARARLSTTLSELQEEEEGGELDSS